MTIDFASGRPVMHCDTCPDHFEGDEAGFDAMRAEASAKGWRSYIGPDKAWANSCPSCTADFAKRRQR